MTFIAALDEIQKGHHVKRTTDSGARYISPMTSKDFLDVISVYEDPREQASLFVLGDFYALDWEVCDYPSHLI